MMSDVLHQRFLLCVSLTIQRIIPVPSRCIGRKRLTARVLNELKNYSMNELKKKLQPIGLTINSR